MIVDKANLFIKCVAASVLVAALTACGNGSSSSTTTPTAVVLSASDLSGTYVYAVTGTDPNDGDYSIAGSFTADGKGTITSAVADYNLGSGIDSSVVQKGTYTVSSNVATITLNDSLGITDSYTATLSKTANVSIFKSDGTGSGTLYQPVTATFAPAGTYSYSLKGDANNAATATGSFVATSAGTFSSGTQAFTDGSVTRNYASVAGFLNPAIAGRGFASFNGNNFAYYVATSNQIVLVNLDDRALLAGSATRQ